MLKEKTIFIFERPIRRIQIIFAFIKQIQMKLINTLILTFLIGLGSNAQTISLKVKGVPDTTVNLVKYVGSKLYYADTAKMVNGKVSFDGSKQEPGVVGLLLPGQKYFEFIYDNNDVQIETASPDFVKNMVVKKSNQNKVFLDYIRYMKKEREAANNYQSQLKKLDSTETEKREDLKKKIKNIGDEVIEYQTRIATEHPNTLVAKIIKMSTDIKIPDAPKDEEGKQIDDEFAYHYYRDHFFDNVDLTDDRLVNTPVLQNKLEKFYSPQVLLQQPDTIVKYLFPIIDQTPKGSKIYRFFVTNSLAHFEKSKIMGMDKVWNKMIARYYCTTDEDGNYNGYWMDKKKLEDLCKDTKKRLHLLIGEIPPNLVLPDSTNKKFYNLYQTKADYTILYFWDPNCGHCKTVTPKLEKLYSEKLKDRNVKVFAVGKATDKDFDDWKKFIREKGLQFINVGVTEELYQKAKKDPYLLINNPPYSETDDPKKTTLQSLNYQDTYDVYSTPTVFVLDKDKRIIAKKLSAAQIERFLDRLQDKEDSEKVLELEENPDTKANPDTEKH